MKTAAIVICLCSALTSSALAAPVRFVGTVPTDLQLSFYATGGSQDFYPTISASRHVDVTIDPATQTSFHDPLSYSIPGTNAHTFTINRPVEGTFNVIPINVSVQLDAFTITKFNHGPLPLNFNGVSEYIEPSILPSYFDPLTITAHWTINGPTQTFTGTFSHLLTPAGVSGFGYNFSNFPNSVTMRRFHNAVYFNDPNSTFFTGMVDGASLDIYLGSAIFDAQNLSSSTINAVPEPSTLVLLALSGIGLYSVARRATKARPKPVRLCPTRHESPRNGSQLSGDHP